MPWVLAAAAGISLAGCAHFVILNDPLSAAEHNDLGVAYENRGESDLARREYRAAIRRDRRLVRAHVNLGNLEASRGRWRAAEERYRGALRLAPDDADALNNLAIALLRRGHELDEATRCAERAVALGGARDSIYRATLAEVRAGRH